MKFQIWSYVGGARIENVRVKVYGVMKSSYIKTLEIIESFEKGADTLISHS